MPERCPHGVMEAEYPDQYGHLTRVACGSCSPAPDPHAACRAEHGALARRVAGLEAALLATYKGFRYGSMDPAECDAVEDALGIPHPRDGGG